MTDLRQRLIDAKLAGSRWVEGNPFAYAFRSNEQAADAALAALGLDDLDAAVERLAASLAFGADTPMDDESRDAFRAALEAALNPTAEVQDAD